MSVSYSLTRRDLEILECLCLRVRYLSLAQVSRTWFQHTKNALANTQERLKLLEQAGLIARFIAMAHPELELARPVYCWQPGAITPNFGAASYQLKSRWTEPPMATPAVIATKQAGARLGGSGGRYPRPTEQTHDLHLAAVFLRFRLLEPELASAWISEETFRKGLAERRGEKVPDAVIRTASGDRVIEFGGAYGKEKLLHFHHYCARLKLAYEVW